MAYIDFRSDTVTKPTKEMLEAMFSAPVGDDVFGEDPTVNALEEKVAKLFGKEAAIFCCSGTQTNQIAINVHVQPGDEVICHYESHVFKYEGGGIARNSGASIRTIDGPRGMISAENISKWLNPDDVHYPVTKLVSIEDTSNRGGGAIYDFEEIKRIKNLCKQHNLSLHLDGARLFNALVETKLDYKTYANEFDSISICLSKGMGAPIGSVLLGNKDYIKKARRVRKVFGGGMRQAGIIAAAGIYAIDHHVNRLKTDHEHAKALEKTFLDCAWVETTLSVETNIVVVILKNAEKRDEIIHYFKENNVLCMAFGVGMLRFVTHLDVSSQQIDQTIEIIKKVNV